MLRKYSLETYDLLQNYFWPSQSDDAITLFQWDKTLTYKKIVLPNEKAAWAGFMECAARFRPGVPKQTI